MPDTGNANSKSRSANVGLEMPARLPCPGLNALRPAFRLYCTATLLSVAAIATAAAQQQPQPQQQQRPSQWATLPRMQLERQFAGPLQDTIVQRWRDPADGSVCYIYLPITAQHTPPTASGFVEYGANVIGSISCFGAPEPPGAAAQAPRRPPVPPAH
jgi:hypothetical protein